MTLGNNPVLVVMAIGIAAPLLAELRVGVWVPVVVLEVVLGIVVGPHVLRLVGVGEFLSAMQSVGDDQTVGHN